MDKNYNVCPKQFKQELIKYYDTGVFSEELGTCIMNSINGLLYSYKFINYTDNWKEFMYGHALTKCVKAVENKSYKVDSGSSPYSYYYRIVHNAFAESIRKLKRNNEAESEYRDTEYDVIMRDHGVYVRPEQEEDQMWDE